MSFPLIGLGLAAAAGLRYVLDKPQANWVCNTLAEGSSKPTINIGAGRDKWGDLRCDISPHGGCFYCNMDDLSRFPDKTFSVAKVSHVLEHTTDPERALKEAQRIADNVIVVLPPATSAFAWLVPSHRWVILGDTPVRNYAPLNWTVLGLAALFIGGYVATRRRK